MRKYSKKSTLSFTKVIEYIGKPSFFLFKICIVGIFSAVQLLKHFIQKIRLPKLKKLPKFHPPKINSKFALGMLACFSASLLTYVYILKDLPSVDLLKNSPPSLTTRIYDRRGTLLYQIYKDENRSLIKLQDLPQHLIDATLAAEDKNFYHHMGIDFSGLTRALINNLKCSIFNVPCSIQGGSTITQQLVKNTLLTPERTFTRKVKELVLALTVEHKYSKDQILEMYFNQVGYGGTSYGIEQASHTYFGKSAGSLTLSESAVLAGLPISPTVLSPFGAHPYLGKIRQQQVLESMVARGMIKENDKLDALAQPLLFNPQGVEIQAPHFVMYIKDLLVTQFGEEAVSRGGLEVYTTLDLDYQNTLQTEISAELLKLKNLHVKNGAGLIINPKTGEILAMAGSQNFFDTQNDGQVNITTQPRQPGSSIKPITYALALSSGLTPSSLIDDSPICFPMQGQTPYCPKNYDGRFHGSVSLRTALASSYNIPAVKLLNNFGILPMIKLARELGITTWEDPSRFGLSLTLGGGEVTMLDLSSVYSVFANNGTKIPFKAIVSVKNGAGKELSFAKNPISSSRVISESVAYQINSILSDPSARSPAFGTNSILNLPGPGVAVKTGTTNSLRDNWTFGYTPDLLVSTWVGNNDNTPMSQVASGITGASPIWARTMKKLLSDHTLTAFARPENMIKVNISCNAIPKYEYFELGHLPKIICASPSPSAQ